MNKNINNNGTTKSENIQINSEITAMPNRENIKPHQWRKGQSGNPKGRPRLLVSSVIEQMKNKGVESISQYDIKATFLMLLNLEIPELESMVKDKDQPVLVRIVGKEMLGGKGFDVIEKMLDRAMGKSEENIKLGGITDININVQRRKD